MRTKFCALAIIFLLLGCSGNLGVPGKDISSSPATSVPGETPKVAPSGNREGNGGDYVRSTFLLMGDAVMKHLRLTGNGQEVVARFNLDLEKLQQTLTIHRIRVKEGLLRDNGNSDVDATGEANGIVLRKEIWADHFEKERDVYNLVFHEMLRACGNRDDDYPISKELNPFPKRERINTRIVPVFKLIETELVQKVFETTKLINGGNGCPNDSLSYLDFDVERNILEYSSSAFHINTAPMMPLFARKNCEISVPISVPGGQRIVVTQVDLAARVGLPEDAELSLTAEVYLTGEDSATKRAGATVTRSYSGIDGTRLDGRVLLRESEMLTTPCGGQYLFRLRTNAKIKTSSTKPATASVDRVAVYLRLEACDRDASGVNQRSHHLRMHEEPLFRL